MFILFTSPFFSRMTADVQDFKSSFKLCISQGLRSGAQVSWFFPVDWVLITFFLHFQVIGSGIAMYMISPTLTAALLGCLPLVFLVGSLTGSQLRRMSRIAHDKVSLFSFFE